MLRLVSVLVLCSLFSPATLFAQKEPEEEESLPFLQAKDSAKIGEMDLKNLRFTPFLAPSVSPEVGVMLVAGGLISFKLDKESKELVGVITEHDALSILAPKRFPSYVFGMPDIKSIHHGTAKTAADIMCCRGVVTCNKDDKIVDALEKMTKHQLRRLPVVEDKKLIGRT